MRYFNSVGACGLDLIPDLFDQWCGLFLAQSVALVLAPFLVARLSIDGKEFIHPCHDLGCNRILGVEGSIPDHKTSCSLGR